MLNILSLFKGVGWGKWLNYGMMAYRFLSRFKGGKGLSLGRLFA